MDGQVTLQLFIFPQPSKQVKLTNLLSHVRGRDSINDDAEQARGFYPLQPFRV